MNIKKALLTKAQNAYNTLEASLEEIKEYLEEKESNTESEKILDEIEEKKEIVDEICENLFAINDLLESLE